MDNAAAEPTLARYVATEAAIGAVINTALSAAIMHLTFGGQARVALWDVPGLAIDFVPQTFFLTLASALAPALITRRRLRRGLRLRGAAGPARPWPLPGPLWARALLLAGAATVVCCPAMVAALAALQLDPMAYDAAMVMKCLYGALLGAVASSVGISAVVFDAARDGAARPLAV
jgi:hypothetical protein